MPFDVVGPMIFPYSLVMDAPQLDIAMHEAETADVHKSTLPVHVHARAWACVCVNQWSISSRRGAMKYDNAIPYHSS